MSVPGHCVSADRAFVSRLLPYSPRETPTSASFAPSTRAGCQEDVARRQVTMDDSPRVDVLQTCRRIAQDVQLLRQSQGRLLKMALEGGIKSLGDQRRRAVTRSSHSEKLNDVLVTKISQAITLVTKVAQKVLSTVNPLLDKKRMKHFDSDGCVPRSRVDGGVGSSAQRSSVVDIDIADDRLWLNSAQAKKVFGHLFYRARSIDLLSSRRTIIRAA